MFMVVAGVVKMLCRDRITLIDNISDGNDDVSRVVFVDIRSSESSKYNIIIIIVDSIGIRYCSSSVGSSVGSSSTVSSSSSSSSSSGSNSGGSSSSSSSSSSSV
ncbi:unnamed protein product [Heterobilharzia americana]|nr:unnamed protein product [Heterobilharzia americana]